MLKVLLVKDYMEKKVVKIPLEATIFETMNILHEGGFSGAPVVDKKGKLVGVISEKDLFAALYPSYQEFYESGSLVPTLSPAELEAWLKSSGRKKIETLITGDPITTAPDEPLVKVGAVMIARNIHRLPVLKKGKLVGIITRHILYKTVFEYLFKLNKKR